MPVKRTTAPRKRTLAQRTERLEKQARQIVIALREIKQLAYEALRAQSLR